MRYAFFVSLLVCLSTVPAVAAPELIFNEQGKVVGIARFNIGGVAYDLWFSPGGLSYNDAVAWFGGQGKRFSSQRRAKKITTRIRRLFNESTPPVLAEDVWWANLNNDAAHGDVIVPYATTDTTVPISYTGWEGGPAYVWGRRPLNVLARDYVVVGGATLTFFRPHTDASAAVAGVPERVVMTLRWAQDALGLRHRE